MSSLYKRATPTQKQMLKIIEGAVKNAYDAHPEITDIKRFARSVSKRAVGTLSSQLATSLGAGPVREERLAGANHPVTKGEVAPFTAEPPAG